MPCGDSLSVREPWTVRAEELLRVHSCRYAEVQGHVLGLEQKCAPHQMYTQGATVWSRRQLRASAGWVLTPDASLSGCWVCAAFNPTKFNPEAWAQSAKAAGMKYFVMCVPISDTQYASVAQQPNADYKCCVRPW